MGLSGVRQVQRVAGHRMVGAEPISGDGPELGPKLEVDALAVEFLQDHDHPEIPDDQSREEFVLAAHADLGGGELGFFLLLRCWFGIATLCGLGVRIIKTESLPLGLGAEPCPKGVES